MIMISVAAIVVAVMLLLDRRSEIARGFQSEFKHAIDFKEAVDSYNKMHVRRRVQK